jgi:hypothetical protein
VLTRAFAELGRLTLSRLIRLDMRGLAARVTALAEENADSPALARAGGLVRWASLFVRNLEMTLYWGATWAIAHVLMLIVGGIAWPRGMVPARLEIAVDFFGGLMFGLAVVRLAITTVQVRSLGSFAGPDPTQPRLVNPPRGPLLLRLLEPTDVDLAVAALAVIVAELLAG